MKKLQYMFVIAAALLLSACATKEELDPSLLLMPEKPLDSYQLLKDSPTCVIAKQNFIVVKSQKPINGILGDLDLYSAYTVTLDRGTSGEKYFTLADYFGNGKLSINFGDFNLANGVYITTTNSKGYYDEYAGVRYVSMSIRSHNFGTDVDVKKGQKVLVLFDPTTYTTRIKFCDAALDLPSTNSGTINGEVVVKYED